MGIVCQQSRSPCSGQEDKEDIRQASKEYPQRPPTESTSPALKTRVRDKDFEGPMRSKMETRMVVERQKINKYLLRLTKPYA